MKLSVAVAIPRILYLGSSSVPRLRTSAPEIGTFTLLNTVVVRVCLKRHRVDVVVTSWFSFLWDKCRRTSKKIASSIRIGTPFAPLYTWFLKSVLKPEGGTEWT